MKRLAAWLRCLAFIAPGPGSAPSGATTDIARHGPSTCHDAAKFIGLTTIACDGTFLR